MESWVNFGAYGSGYFSMITHPETNPAQRGLKLSPYSVDNASPVSQPYATSD